MPTKKLSAIAKAPAIHYRVEIADLHAHLFRVTLTIARPQALQRVSLPVWIPGSYLVREFSKNLQALRARQTGKALPAGQLNQVDKCTWDIRCKADQPLRLSYEVYANDNSVRTAWLDANRGFFNGSSLCLQVQGQKKTPHALELVASPAIAGPTITGDWTNPTRSVTVRIAACGGGTLCGRVVRASGEAKAKVALVDGTTESSLTRNGDDVWAWSSTKQEAVHSTLDAQKAKPSGTPTSPSAAIKELLEKVQPSTEVVTSGTGYVAGRAVYQLVLTPKDDDSLVGQVRVSVDAESFVPLGLRVIADDNQDAITVAASSVDYTVPAASVFDFQPPAGVTVTEHKDDSGPAKTGSEAGARPKTFGSGWATVAVMDLPTSEKADEPASANEQSKVLLESLPVVSGDWGKGRLLSTVLVNAVITDDGRVAVGSVVPERLYEALAAK